MTPVLGIIASSNQQGRGGAGAVGSYDALNTITLTSAASSIIFSNIPSSYEHLQIRGRSRATSGNQYYYVRFNSDSATSYTYHGFFGNGSTAVTDTGLSQTGAGAMSSVAGSVGANFFAPCIIDILDYANPNKNKSMRNLDGIDYAGTGQIVNGSGMWINTSAINSIELVPNASTFAIGSQFALYGIK
jgi:hypothetical protein